MENYYSLLAILVGLALRLFLPIGITLLVITLLRKLDERWQVEAENELKQPLPALAQNWDLKECPIEKRKPSPVSFSSIPCWQFNRLSNGYLHEECLTCKVFHNAPLPAHAHA